MQGWQKWMLGVMSALLVAWVGRVESHLYDIPAILGELKHINQRLERIERKLDNDNG